MQIDIINIGNSKGIRIPAFILEQFENPRSFNVEFNSDSITLTSKKKIREGWEESFSSDLPDISDENLLSDLDFEFDEEEWTW